MYISNPDLSVLTRECVGDHPLVIPRPPRRWKSRVLVPAGVVICTGGLLAYSARNVLISATDVWVIPVVALPRNLGLDSAPTLPSSAAGGEMARHLLVQAPGWIEPDPYPINVPALAEGVIREVLVLEGSQVEAGQVVARLIDDEARLTVEAADARLEALQAEVAKARAELGAAELRTAEIDDQLKRLREWATTGGAAQGELVQLEFRFKAAQLAAVSAQAALAIAEAEIRAQTVAGREARLVLARMDIVSPAAGTVMARFMEPGSRVSMGNRGSSSLGDGMVGTVLRLYDPTRLQVRVDVPLADFAKIQIGSPAEIVTEALAETVFRGQVTRVVHEANIQRNTVQVKVGIANPDEILKPEMQVRVRFFGSTATTESVETSKVRSNGGSATSKPAEASNLRLLVSESALDSRESNAAKVWRVERPADGSVSVVVPCDLSVSASSVPGFVEVTEGVQPGDRLVADPPAGLKKGQRVRVVGEKP